MAQGNKSQALMQLKKAKAAEKQLETATATHAALESQVDVLEQRAAARSGVRVVGQRSDEQERHKGLLSKAENAVDGAEEIKDMSEEVATALGGLQVEQWDEDELLAELEEMGAPEPTPVATETKKSVKFAEVAPVAEAKNVVFGVNAEQWPEAPTTTLLQSQDNAHAMAQ